MSDNRRDIDNYKPDVKAILKAADTLVAEQGGRPRLETWHHQGASFVKLSITWKYQENA